MHNQTDTLDETTTLEAYEWPVCTACGRQLWVEETDRRACRPCEDQTATRLAELPGLFTQLNTTAMLMKGANHDGSPTTGTRTAPIPPRIDVLNLISPGGITTQLRDIEDAWRKAFNRRIAPWTGNPTEAIPVHTSFLAINLRRACEEYDSIGQDIDGIRKLHAECKALANNERRPGRVPIGACPVRLDNGPCSSPLAASTGSHRVRCSSCGTRWDGLAEWRSLRTAQEAVAAEQAKQLEAAA